jgi:hypothetical protein
MSTYRVWFGLIALVAISVAGDRYVRSNTRSSKATEQMLVAASEAVRQFPESIGPWKMVSSDPLPDRVLEILQCSAHQSRDYVHEETGQKVSFILLVGAAGPLVAHTPEVCYSSADYEVLQTAQPEVIRGTGDAADVFDRVVFRSKKVTGEKLRVHYAWRRPNGHWQAPKNPRLSIGGSPLLYKVQLATTDESNSDDSAADSSKNLPDERFLADLLPTLDSLLHNR